MRFPMGRLYVHIQVNFLLSINELGCERTGTSAVNEKLVCKHTYKRPARSTSTAASPAKSGWWTWTHMSVGGFLVF